jgi:ubiquinone/menaquinone biosynthesis C-methylase UbiE
VSQDKLSECTIEKCDIFDFMAKYVGLSVLHPGGFSATEKLAEECKIDKETRVLDIACGKGTSSIFLAQKYGCHVEGLDISEDLIEEAWGRVRRKGVSDTVSFRVGDALDLPYSENEFDVAVSQAMLILVSDKKKAIQEARRVLKPGGNAGWLELSWKNYPNKEFLHAVSNEICAYCMTNVITYEAWEKLFHDAGFSQVKVIRSSMTMSGMKGMVRDEGFGNVMKVMAKYLFNTRVRKRMMNLNKFINSNPQYFGYGIYITKK